MRELSQPFANMRFRVEIEGLTGTGAVEVIFPEARIVAAGGRSRRNRFGALTLRRGLTQSSEWYDWWSAARPTPRAVSVVLLDANGADAVRWIYSRARPVAYLLSGLNALGNEALVESLELTVGGFAAAFPGTPPRVSEARTRSASGAGPRAPRSRSKGAPARSSRGRS